MEAVATKEATSVTPKAYVHSWVGVTPAAWRGSVRFHGKGGRERRTLQCGADEADVSGLIERNLLQVVVEGRVKAGSSELCLGEVGKTFTVELVLKVLEGESILEDIS
jgi:hypothetical protein